tara:strand:- start:1450 stop:1575 length:126 start_codon:yes stop_codon:yes gene_type:complete
MSNDQKIKKLERDVKLLKELLEKVRTMVGLPDSLFDELRRE